MRLVSTVRSHSRFFVGVVVGGILAATVTYAAIPNTSTGQITACYGTDKVLKVTSTTCPAGTTKVSWQSQGLRFLGAWSSTRSYVANDVVTAAGSSYRANKASLNVAVTNTSSWSVLSARGATGAQGSTGATGATGPQGRQGATSPQYGRVIAHTITLDNSGTGYQFGVPGHGTNLAGNPVALYSFQHTDPVTSDLTTRFAMSTCPNRTCTGAPTVSIIEQENLFTSLGVNSAMTFGDDGNPLIVYPAYNTHELHIAACVDPTCTSPATITTIATGSFNYQDITIGPDGLPLFAYYDNVSTALKVAHCTTTNCTGTITSNTVESGTTPRYLKITINSDGLPVLHYNEPTGHTFVLATCADALCSTPPSFGQMADALFAASSMVIGPDGIPLESVSSGNHLYVVRCINVACTGTPTMQEVDAASTVTGSAITIGTNGLPIIAYHAQNGGDVTRYAECADLICSSAHVQTISTNYGFTSIGLTGDGNPFIAINDNSVGGTFGIVLTHRSWTPGNWGN